MAAPRVLTLDQWKGQNSQAGRSAIDDQELFWSQNLQPVGPSNLVMLPDNGAALWTPAGGVTILSFACYVRGTSRYAAAFMSDGSAVEVNLGTGAAVGIAGSGTFSPLAPYVPRVAAWGSSGIVIVSRQTNGYWAWDGTLYAAGAASPAWLNGGTATTMPSGVSGNAVTVFQSRVVVANGNTVSISAPNNGATFAASAGGTTFSSTDPFLQQAFMDLQQSSGFLYLFGDSSVNALSNIQTSGSPATTTFYNANVDPQVGHAFPLPGVPFGRALCFANSTGVYALLGGAARKISDKMNNLFSTLAPSPVPSMSLVYLNGIKCLAVLMRCTTTLGAAATLILLWDGEKWCVATQTKNLIQIAMSMQNSVPQLWGTDGATLFQCFAGSPSTLAARMVTKYYPGPDPLALKMLRSVFLDMSGNGASATITVDTDRGKSTANVAVSAVMSWTNSLGQLIAWTNNASQPIVWSYAGEQLQGSAASATGLLLGFDVSFTATSLAVARFLATFDDLADIGR